MLDILWIVEEYIYLFFNFSCLSRRKTSGPRHLSFRDPLAIDSKPPKIPHVPAFVIKNNNETSPKDPNKKQVS